MTDEEIKMNWLAICESDASMTAIHNLREHYKQLEKENAELKAQVEKMKRCTNCNNYSKQYELCIFSGGDEDYHCRNRKWELKE